MWSYNIRPHYNVSHLEYESPSLVSEQEMIRIKIHKFKSYK